MHRLENKPHRTLRAGESLSDSEQEDDAGDDRLDYDDGWLRQDDDIGASDQVHARLTQIALSVN